ncbi:Alpha-tocopherol transfer protein-like [Halotydeus destructor]|nr:Alpha-tocopherol transfer protein-like [Halotydeus destructor]
MTLTELRGCLQETGVLKTKMADELLQAFLNVTDSDVEAACQRIKRYTMARKMYPGLFGQVGAAKKLLASGMATFFPSKSPSSGSVLYIASGNWNPGQDSHEEFNACVVTILEHKAIECSLGVHLVFDQRGFGMKHLARLSPKSMLDCIELYSNILPVRMINVVNFECGMAARAAWKVLAPFLSKQIAATNVMLGRDIKRLHELVAPSVLPDDCGGLCGAFDSGRYLAELEADEVKLVNKWNDYQV